MRSPGPKTLAQISVRSSVQARKKLGWEPKHTSDFFDGIAAAGAAGKLGGQYKGTEAVEPAKA